MVIIIFLESMRKFGEAQRKHKGLIMITGLKDETKGHNWAGHLDYKGNTSLQLARP